MGRGLLIAAVAAVALYVVVVRGGRGAGLTKEDLPKLRELQLRKARLGLELALCLQSKARSDWKKAFSSAGIGAFVGAFVGVVAGGAGPGVKAARATANIVKTLWPKGDDCAAQAQQMVQDLAAHDALSAELGLDPDLAVEDIQAIANSLGGYASVQAEIARQTTARSEQYHGKGYIDASKASTSQQLYGLD